MGTMFNLVFVGQGIHLGGSSPGNLKNTGVVDEICMTLRQRNSIYKGPIRSPWGIKKSSSSEYDLMTEGDDHEVL